MGEAERVAGVRQRGSGRLPWLVLAGVLVLVVWRVGPGKIPNVEGIEYIARTWPTFPLSPVDAYVLRQAVGQAVYHGLGWVGTGPYLALHAGALLATAVLVMWWFLRLLGTQRGTIACCILLVAPVTAVLLEWVGIYDAFSVLVWAAFIHALRRRAPVQVVVAVVGGLQNYEQFVASVVLLALLPELPRSLGLRVRFLPVLLGATLGKICLELYLAGRGAAQGSRLTFLADGEMQHLVLTTFLALAPVVVWSALGPLWVTAARSVPECWSTWSRSLRMRITAAAFIVLVLGIVTGDHTRVMALVTFPLTILVAAVVARRETDVSGWLRRPDTVLLLVTPALVVWGDVILPLGLDPAVWWP